MADQLAVWLNGADAGIARARAESFLKNAKSLDSYSGSPDRPLGMSIGIAVWTPGSESLEQILVRADAAMYDAKRAGKGGFAMAPAPGATSSAPEALLSAPEALSPAPEAT